FVLGLVRQHRATDRIADGVDTRNIGGIVRVGLHPAAFVQFDAGADALGVGAATDRQQDDVGLQFLRGAALRRFYAQRDAVVALARAGHLHAEAELHALPRQDALEC